MAHTTLAGWAWVVAVSGLLIGCASGPNTLGTLQEARVTLDRARSADTAAAHARILEAEGALTYAEQEYRLSPGHPLSHARAETALEKARAAYQATMAPRRTKLAAH